MKIGILTIHDSPNYGANLQCYGLWKYLTNQGYDCEVIDLHRPGAHADYIHSRRYGNKREKKKNYLQRLKYSIKRFLAKNRPAKEHYNNEAKIKFREFNNLMNFSAPYVSVDSLYKTPPQYDIYIAGSDQLWNPTQPYCIEPYFLNFVNCDKSKKISYATSIGLTELTESEKKQFREWLQDFNAISVREKQAKVLLDSFTNLKIEVVCDPTFLLRPDEWSKLAIRPELKEPYILLFPLGMRQELLDYCIKLSKETNMKLVVLNQLQEVPENNLYIAIKNAGPKEFLGYISAARFVVTDSFHGTVFSILLSVKNFCSFVPAGNRVGSRIEDLLKTFGLSEHLLKEPLNMSFRELDSHIVNQEMNGHIIDKIRKEGTAFLTKSICQ